MSVTIIRQILLELMNCGDYIPVTPTSCIRYRVFGFTPRSVCELLLSDKWWLYDQKFIGDKTKYSSIPRRSVAPAILFFYCLRVSIKNYK